MQSHASATVEFAPATPAQRALSIGTHDQRLLLKTFLYINKTYFGQQIDADVRWQVPQGTVTVAANPRAARRHLTDQEQAELHRLISRGQLDAACDLLTPLAEAACSDAQLLLSHVMRKLHRPMWTQWAERYTTSTATRQVVPAACYYPSQRLICVHPYLCERRAPQWVLRYLMYHECCHQLIDSPCHDPHPPAFMALEAKAPNRERAVAWLQKEGFPTLD